ncbi:MAG: serine/threonine protein kinase [Myxococcales bacterium]|nr:serine/threonine protein kinase [Myxococcales bacterium]
MRAAAIPSGMRLGRYEIVRHLATGGMAEIYLARASGIGDFERYVVIKVIAGERRGNAQFVRMFLDEARLAAGLHHASIAQVYEVGEDGGEFYYAMEYVHGDTVRSLLDECSRAQVRIPLEVAIAVAIGAASGLHHAHERESADGRPLDIVHRDVSPSNVMVGYDGAVKVLDFGIARASERATETESGVVKGKYAYMAPEQCRAQPVDRRADVFALGIVLYELATQHRAFKADSDFETMSRIVNGEITPPTMLVPGFPPALEAIVLRAMAPAPARRYQTAAELGDALEAFAESHGLAISQRAVERFMQSVYGARPEPWRAAGAAARSGGGTPRPGPALPLPAPAGSQPSGSAAGLRTPGPNPPPAAALTPSPVASLPRTDSLVAPAVTLTPAPEPARRSLARPVAVGLGLVAAGVLAAVLASGGGGPSASGTASTRVAGAGAPSSPTPTAPASPAPASPAAPLATATAAPTAPPAAPATPPAPVEAPAAPRAVAAPPAAATVTIHLESTPPGAAVYVGKARRGATPLDLTVPRGDRPLAVRLERAGYRVASLALPVDRDGRRAVTLTKKPLKPGGGDDGFANPFAK